MRAVTMYGPGDVRAERCDDAKILRPTDAVVRTVATCVCGSDLWPYRGADPVTEPVRMGHEYVGVVEEVGPDVAAIRPGQFVVGSFCIADNTCANCRNGWQSSCRQLDFMNACQAEYIRVPYADGMLVATDGHPDASLVPSLLAVSDVMGTGWYAAVAAEVRPGSTVVVVGDGAVGLCGVIAAKELGAERIIAMSRNETRQELALHFGATDIIAERGDDGVAGVQELTGGIGADSVLECVGTDESMEQAVRSARPGGNVGFVGVPHDVALASHELFFSQVGLRGGPAPVRRFLPDLIDRVLTGRIDPGKVFDLELPLEKAAEAYRAMYERRAVKVLLQP
ncbi:threonine dehydrogenase-like Zn-dependent dehydrogenase [Kribbella sp. VKM Ac-2527]|uniref:Threonine dehydrogenase-like Zn-dependent dehydrogenase n=1 Tax=Kribbella caucasensis TaxID=2512215 RepID=A0A4R6KLQ7_9ACTN|nr:zinc-dependent alcohol dehydrogenase family protein [Kribbella sp. VKM Ac-2527]TDO51726.1 threonine dehydrogenase-like Zn-dependent dehydrogenase [Kribbella sp. VKM Ac-2527]